MLKKCYYCKMNQNPKREPNESFADYKERRKQNNIDLRFKMQGELVWESKTDGTYVKIQHDKKLTKETNKK